MFATAGDGAAAAPPGRAWEFRNKPVLGVRRPAAYAASCGRSPYYSADVLMSPIGIGENNLPVHCA